MLCVAPVDDDASGEAATGEVRHETVDALQQRRLARPGAAHDEAHLTGVDLEVDIDQHRRRRIGVRHADVLEADHAATSAVRRLVGATRAGCAVARGTGGAIQAGSAASSETSTSCHGRFGMCSGRDKASSVAGSACATTTYAAATATPVSATSTSAVRQRSGR